MSDATTIPDSILLPAAAYFLAANLLALGLFALRRAESGDGEWRGPETRTLVLSMMGGWLGAKIGQLLFHPEEEARGFTFALNVSALVLPVALALPFVLHAAPGWIGQAYQDYVAGYAAPEASDAPTAEADAAAGAETGQAAPAKAMPKKIEMTSGSQKGAGKTGGTAAKRLKVGG